MKEMMGRNGVMKYDNQMVRAGTIAGASEKYFP